MLGVSLWCGYAISAGAQQNDRDDFSYTYARNKIGLLHYCRDKGLLGQATVKRAAEAIEIDIGRLAISDGLVKARGDRTEKAGEAGVWEANGQRDLATIADLFGTTIAAICKELAGETRKIQQPPVAKRVAPKATKPSARLNAKRSTAAVKPAAPPTVSPKPAPPSFWALSPFEVNKWRFNRRERPWSK
jgi:hypothetical protein